MSKGIKAIAVLVCGITAFFLEFRVMAAELVVLTESFGRILLSAGTENILRNLTLH